MINLKIEQYNKDFEKKWDKFILSDSLNGTFLQTKNFLNYHPIDRFEDDSLIIIKGTDTIAALIPACTMYEGSEKIFFSHPGSTFGGILLRSSFNNIEHVHSLFLSFNEYIKKNNYTKVIFKNTSSLFSKGNTTLIDYFLFKDGYKSYDEISFYIDFEKYKEDIISNFSAGKRRDYKYSLKYGMEFRKLTTTEQIENFYSILCDNLKKFSSNPVHTLEELIDFKQNRLSNITDFYGVYKDDQLIAGCMIFKFGKEVFHTQYLAADQNYLNLFPMNFLDANLISIAKQEGFKYFSFGTSTQDHGKILNYNLAQFKEGFGTTYSINRTYYKELEN